MITFDTEIANIGNSMDASSGTFTTKRKGLYFFTFYGVSSTANKRTVIWVQKNGKNTLVIEDGENSVTQTNISSSWMLHLDEGETIRLQLNGGDDYNGLHGCESEDWIYFTGQLLNSG